MYKAYSFHLLCLLRLKAHGLELRQIIIKNKAEDSYTTGRKKTEAAAIILFQKNCRKYLLPSNYLPEEVSKNKY